MPQISVLFFQLGQNVVWETSRFLHFSREKSKTAAVLLLQGVQCFQVFTHSSYSNLIASLLEGGRFQAIFQYVKTQAIHRPRTLIIMVCKYLHTICHILFFWGNCVQTLYASPFAMLRLRRQCNVCNSNSGACKELFELKFVFLREYIGQHIVDKIVCKFYAEYYCSTML